MAYYPENDKRWREKNKEKVKHGNARRQARSFVKNYATLEELKDLKERIAEREKELIEILKDGNCQ